jgi:hypothetical protein
VPLYEQITNRIKAKVMARLGDEPNTRDRYFIIPFAYENKENDPSFRTRSCPLFACSLTTNNPR